MRWMILLVCAATLAQHHPCAVAQSSAAKPEQGPAVPAVPHTSDKQSTRSETAIPPFVLNNAPRVDAREIKLDGRPVRGAKDAKVTIVLFDDFQCPYSAFMYKTLFEEVKKDYADRVKVALRDAPNTKEHSWARHAAINAECLAAQNDEAYWDFTDYVHAHQKDIEVNPPAVLDRLAIEQGQKHGLQIPPLQQCITTQSDVLFEASRREAIRELGIRDVPTLLINGEKVVGSQNAQPLREAIDRALREAGQPVPAPATTVPVSTPAESQQHVSLNSSNSSNLGRSNVTQGGPTTQASPVSSVPPDTTSQHGPLVE